MMVIIYGVSCLQTSNEWNWREILIENQELKKSILSIEEKLRQLSSQLRDTSNKLVVTKKDNEELQSTVPVAKNTS